MLYFIVNPAAGGGRALQAEAAVRAELELLRRPAAFLRTQAPGQAADLAREAAAKPDSEAVISISGDGTAYEVAAGLLDSGRPMGIIPAGTGNDLIKTLGIPGEPLAALHHLLEKPARPVDAAQINGRLFLNVCGTGFDVMVLDQAERYKKRLRGLLPYMLGLLRAIAGYRPVHVRYTVDGEAHEADTLLFSVANGRFIGGGIPICPAAVPDDGMLDLVLVRNVPRWQIPFYLPGLMGRRVLRFRITSHRLVERVMVTSPGMRMQLDGEILPMDEADICVLSGRLLMHW